MRMAVVIALTAGLASGCAGANRLLSYGNELADATAFTPFGTYSIYVHPADDTLLIQPKVVQASARKDDPVFAWRRVAENFVAPVGCGISTVSALSTSAASWEANYVCPPGVDLRALILSQRSDLRAGKALHR